MKNKLRKAISKASIWISLLVISNIFFIFMLWIISPEKFKILASLMIIFSFFITLIGIFFEAYKLNKEEIYFRRFIEDPSQENEAYLLNIISKNYIDVVKISGEKLRDLERIIKDNEEKYIEYKDLIESWVHEIKTPIHLGALVLDNRQDEMSDLVKKRFSHVLQRVSSNLDILLYYARIQDSHLNIRLRRNKLEEIVEDVIFDLNNLIKEKEINLDIKLKAEDVVTDETSLKFILSQVIGNSIKYSKDEDKKIIISSNLVEEDGSTYLEIKDNGIGIREEDLPFIFDKGFTGNYENQNKSTGIGLYLVKRYCDLLKIDIEFDSEKDKGFSIRFIFSKVD